MPRRLNFISILMGKARNTRPTTAGCRKKLRLLSRAFAKVRWPTVPASKVRNLRRSPIATGAPIRATACARFSISARAISRKRHELDARAERSSAHCRRGSGAHGLHAPARQGAETHRRQAIALAYRRPAKAFAIYRTDRYRDLHQSA